MSNRTMRPELLALLAEHFRVLADPTRLEIMHALRTGEATVSELIERTDAGQANVSKHLQLLHAMGFVRRRKEGLYVYYALADRSVFALCDIMCGRVEAQEKVRRRLLAG